MGMKTINKNQTNKDLFKNTGIIAIGQISTKIVNFLLLPLYTALLTTEEYGIVDLLTTYSMFIAVVIGLQMHQAIFRFLVTNRDNDERIRTITSTIVTATGAILILYTALFVLIQPIITLDFKWYLLIYVIISLSLQTASGIARGLGKNSIYAMGNFLSAFVMIVLNVILIAILRYGVMALLFSHIVGPFVGTLYIVFRTKIWKYYRIRETNKNELKTILNYAVPLVPNELSWTVIHTSDRMIISMFLSVAVNGLIAVAAKISTIYTTIFSIFNTSWTEQVVLHYKDEGGPEYVCKMFDRMVTFFASMAIGIIACIPFVFSLLINRSFGEAYGLIPWYMIAVFFNAVIGMIAAIYLIENETKQVAFSTMVAAGINVAVDLLLVKSKGMYAAPISSICGYLTVSFWRLWDINKRHCKISMSLKKVVILVIVMCMTLGAYYYGNIFIQTINLIIVALIALMLNFDFLKELASMIKKK